MEVAAAVGLATAVNSAVRAATGKSIAQNCSSLLNKVRSKVLGTVVDVKAKGRKRTGTAIEMIAASIETLKKNKASAVKAEAKLAFDKLNATGH